MTDEKTPGTNTNTNTLSVGGNVGGHVTVGDNNTTESDVKTGLTPPTTLYAWITGLIKKLFNF